MTTPTTLPTCCASAQHELITLRERHDQDAMELSRLQSALQVGQRHLLLAVVPVGHAQLMMGVVLVGVLAEDVQIVVDGLGKLAGVL